MDQQYYAGTEDTSWWSKFKSNFAELAEFVAIILVIYAIIHLFVAEPHQVSGNSMYSNLQDQNLIITNKLATRFADFKRGEVIVFQNPRDASQDYIKRIIGLAGEKIMIQNNVVYINGQPLSEPYLPSNVITRTRGFMGEGQELTIPEGSFFTMGDNREGSSDSREWGPLKKELIVGQAWLRYWPLNKFQLLETNKGYK